MKLSECYIGRVVTLTSTPAAGTKCAVEAEMLPDLEWVGHVVGFSQAARAGKGVRVCVRWSHMSHHVVMRHTEIEPYEH